MNTKELKIFLDEKARLYQNTEFLQSDPIQIPHRFEKKEDIEIAGFLTSTIAWGNRLSIIRSANRMMNLMEESPFDFTINASDKEINGIKDFVHRTFNSDDFQFFIHALRHIYLNHGGLEEAFSSHAQKEGVQMAITSVREHFFEIPHPKRSEKHFSNPQKGSAAKRINMFLRWMVRPSEEGVDFGIWKRISPAHLSCPLDVHSAKVARALGLLHRKQNDSRAVEELDRSLRLLDPKDPVKYDFALFGLGVFEKFP